MAIHGLHKTHTRHHAPHHPFSFHHLIPTKSFDLIIQPSHTHLLHHVFFIHLPTSLCKHPCPCSNTSSIPSSISETQEIYKPSCLYPLHRILHCWDLILQSLRFQTCCHSNLIWCNLSRWVLQTSGGEMELGYVDSSNLPPPKVPKA